MLKEQVLYKYTWNTQKWRSTAFIIVDTKQNFN